MAPALQGLAAGRTNQGSSLDIPIDEPLAGWPVSPWRALRAEDRYTALHNGYKILVWSRMAVQFTGSKTDRFNVWDILASSRVVPIRGFDVVSV